MGRGINKVILIGNLGADPEVRYSGNGHCVANLRLATNEQFRKDDETQTRTEWHRVVAFGRRAEVAGEYLRKGAEVYIEGRLQTRKWADDAGAERYVTEVVVTDLSMLGSRRDNGADASPPARGGKGRTRKAQQPPAESDGFNDAIPF